MIALTVLHTSSIVLLFGFPIARTLCKLKAKGSKGVDMISWAGRFRGLSKVTS